MRGFVSAFSKTQNGFYLDKNKISVAVKKNIYLNMFINKSQSSAKLTSVTRLN